MHSFVFPHSSDQLSIIAVGLLLLMSGNFPLSLSLRFYPFYIYIYYTIVSTQHNCASLWDVWLVCAYIHPLSSVPGITLLVGGDTNSSMTRCVTAVPLLSHAEPISRVPVALW